jgi:restriction endonuclease S subunit
MIQFFQSSPDEAIVSTLSARLIWSHFIELLSIKDPLARYFYAAGTNVFGISKTNIPKLTLPVPIAPAQTAIADVLSDMDAQLAALKQRRDKIRALKQGMMQELLTGSTRLV